jgi:hypothetical protein
MKKDMDAADVISVPVIRKKGMVAADMIVEMINTTTVGTGTIIGGPIARGVITDMI